MTESMIFGDITYLCVFLSVCLFAYLSVYLSEYLFCVSLVISFLSSSVPVYVMMQDQEDKPTHSLSKINIGLEVMWLFFVKDQGVWYVIQKF